MDTERVLKLERENANLRAQIANRDDEISSLNQTVAKYRFELRCGIVHELADQANDADLARMAKAAIEQARGDAAHLSYVLQEAAFLASQPDMLGFDDKPERCVLKMIEASQINARLREERLREEIAQLKAKA